MHKLIEAAGRRSTGLAAGVILTGGLVGGVLLAPAAAYAATTTTTTTVTATAQVSAIDVTVSVTPTGATGRVSVSDGAGGGCSTFGSGSCTISNVPAGTYTVTANYQGSGGGFPGQGSGGGYSPSSGTAPTPVTVAGGPSTPPTQGPPQGGNAPVFTADSPPSSVSGSSYSYQFSASNSPSYQLVGAPSWLGINNGNVSGNIPNGTNSFSFSVYAWNQWGHRTIGPFWVYFHQHQNYNHHNYFNDAETNISTSLYCTSPVYNGGSGTCTLRVSNSNQNFFWGPVQYNNNFGQHNNFGQNFASDITAQISLPYQLKAEYCGYSYSYYNGCHIYGNTAYENIGNLYPGQSRSLTVHFRVEPGFNIWVYDHGHPFLVIVNGSASSNSGIFNLFGRGQSSSTAYVWIRR